MTRSNETMRYHCIAIIVDAAGSDVLAHAQDFFGARLDAALPCPGDLVRYGESITPRGVRALAWAIHRAE